MEYCLPLRISQSVEYQLPMPRPPMLRVPTALTSSSLPGLMLVFMSSPGDGRASVLFSALTCLAASLLCLGVAVGLPGMGFSTGTSVMTSVVVVVVGPVWGLFWGLACGLFAGGADVGVCAGGVLV